jgi:hypothetical protein
MGPANRASAARLHRPARCVPSCGDAAQTLQILDLARYFRGGSNTCTTAWNAGSASHRDACSGIAAIPTGRAKGESYWPIGIVVLLHRLSASTTSTLDLNGASGQTFVMNQPISLSSVRDDTLWAVVASIGRTHRVAEIFPSRQAAMADRAWREQQVLAYAGFLSRSLQPAPNYSIRPIRRAELPRSWRPLPALGFLHGKLV